MLTENDASSRRRRDPWNKGRLIGQKRPLKPKDVWTIRVRLRTASVTWRCSTSLSTASSGAVCDLVRLQINDVCAGGRVRDRATVIQKKTGRPVQFEITEPTRAAVADWLSSLSSLSGHSYLFPEPIPAAAARFHATVCPHRPSVGRTGWSRQFCLWHPLDAAHEAGPDRSASPPSRPA